MYYVNCVINIDKMRDGSVKGRGGYKKARGPNNPSCTADGEAALCVLLYPSGDYPVLRSSLTARGH